MEMLDMFDAPVPDETFDINSLSNIFPDMSKTDILLNDDQTARGSWKMPRVPHQDMHIFSPY